MNEGRSQIVLVRDERVGDDVHTLWAYLDRSGRLHIEGEDLGRGNASISSEGEYEWHETIAATDVPKVVELLGGSPDDDVLQLLEQNWSGVASYDLEVRLRTSGLEIEREVWGG